jgi:F0F1-type ATP synthase membrane subunit b/b'
VQNSPTAPDETGESPRKGTKMTPAQKAKRTKLEKKYYAEYEEAIKQVNQDLYAFCETLYPERDAKIAAAEAKMNQIIKDAQAEFEAISSEAISLIENHPEVIRLEKVRDEISSHLKDVLFKKIAAIEI